MIRESWLPIAKTLGYESEEAMLRDLYLVQRMSVANIAKRLGFSISPTRIRMRIHNIPARGRGGPQRTGKKIQIPVEDLFGLPVEESAQKHNVSVCLIMKRRKEHKNAIHGNSLRAAPVSRPAGTSEAHADDSGAEVPEGRSVPGSGGRTDDDTR